VALAAAHSSPAYLTLDKTALGQSFHNFRSALRRVSELPAIPPMCSAIPPRLSGNASRAVPAIAKLDPRIPLGEVITSPPLNPYDKARAIESYLAIITLYADLSAPPSSPGLLLFEKRAGIANISPAMTVMMRAVGVPALT